MVSIWRPTCKEKTSSDDTTKSPPKNAPLYENLVIICRLIQLLSEKLGNFNSLFSKFFSSTIQAGSGNLYAECLVLWSSIIIICWTPRRGTTGATPCPDFQSTTGRKRSIIKTCHWMGIAQIWAVKLKWSWNLLVLTLDRWRRRQQTEVTREEKAIKQTS